MFSVNLTFDKTLMMQICCFFSAKIATIWAVNVLVFRTQLEYFCAQPLYSSMLKHTQLTVNVHQQEVLNMRSLANKTANIKHKN